MKSAVIENAVIWLVANVVLFLVLDEKYDFVLGPLLTAAGMLVVTLLEVGAKRLWHTWRGRNPASPADTPST
ncbi:hypothetical protein [Arthrobacter pigmenti]